MKKILLPPAASRQPPVIIPKFAIEHVLRRKGLHKNVQANFWDNSINARKSRRDFLGRPLRCKFCNILIAKFRIIDNARKIIGLAIFFMSFWIAGCYSQNITAIRQDLKEPISSEQENKDPYLWDFGKVKEGVILEHEFVFINESKVVLNIKDINTSCGCTVSEVKKKKLLPGQSTLISVKFDSKGYSGQVRQYLYMNTDAIDNPIIRYIIKVEVVK